MMGTEDIKMKESPEQKRTQNEEETMEMTMVCILFMETEEMIYKEEEPDKQATHQEKVKTKDTQNDQQKQETNKMSKDEDETKNKKEKRANGLTTKVGENERPYNDNKQRATTEPNKEY